MPGEPHRCAGAGLGTMADGDTLLKNMENNMKANYDQLNWQVINQDVAQAMEKVQLDSLQKVYTMALSELEKAEKEMKGKSKVNCNPIPDASIQDLSIAKETLRKNIEAIKAVSRPKKIVRL